MRMSNKLGKAIINSLRRAAVTGIFVMYSATAMAGGLPENGNFAAGSGSISTSGNTMTITQNETNAAIKWGSFNIANGNTVNFQSNVGGVFNILNFDANGKNPSQIMGAMNAIGGNVWVVNPNGVVIGKDASVNVNSLHLSTHNLDTTQLEQFGSQASIPSGAELGAGQLMSLGNISATRMTFEGNRVVLDVDKFSIDTNGKDLKTFEDVTVTAKDADNVVAATSSKSGITYGEKDVTYAKVDSLASIAADGKYALTSNISITAPVSLTGGTAFSGKLEGLGNTVNMNINNTGATNLGLFAKTDGATISDLNLTGTVSGGNADVDGGVGSVAGVALNTTISNVYSDVVVKGNASKIIDTRTGNEADLAKAQELDSDSGLKNRFYYVGAANLGGLVGNASNVTMNDVVFDGKVLGEEFSTNYGNTLSGLSNYSRNVGGAIGVLHGNSNNFSGVVVGVLPENAQSGTIAQNAEVKGYHNVGGFVGLNMGTIDVGGERTEGIHDLNENIHVHGLIVGHRFVGGVAGVNAGTIKDANLENHVLFHTMDSDSKYLGGIAGLNVGILNNVENQADIVINYGNYVAGITGQNGLAGRGSSTKDASEHVKLSEISREFEDNDAIGSKEGTINDANNIGRIHAFSKVAGIVAENTAHGVLLSSDENNRTIINRGKVESWQEAGGIIAENYREFLENHHVSMENTGDIEAYVLPGDSHSNKSNIAGIIGLNHANINGVIMTNRGNILGEGDNVGGVIANSYMDTIINGSQMTNYGNVNGIHGAGGIIGISGQGATDIADRIVNSTLINYGTIKGETEVGGIFGTLRGNTDKSSLINKGDIYAGAYSGGVVGSLYGSIVGGRADDKYTYQIYNDGAIKGYFDYEQYNFGVDATHAIGGVVGYLVGGKVIGAYNTGDIDVSKNYFYCDTNGEYKQEALNNSTTKYYIDKLGSQYTGAVVGLAEYDLYNDNFVDQVFNIGNIKSIGEKLSIDRKIKYKPVSNIIDYIYYEDSETLGQAGGIIGGSLGFTTVTNAYSTGNITSTTGNNEYVGLISGENFGLIGFDNVYATYDKNVANGAVSLLGSDGGWGFDESSFATAKKFEISDTQSFTFEGSSTSSVVKMANVKENYGDSFVNAKDQGGNDVWKFYDGYTTPLLKMFLTKVTAVNGETTGTEGNYSTIEHGDVNTWPTFTYNGYEQGFDELQLSKEHSGLVYDLDQYGFKKFEDGKPLYKNEDNYKVVFSSTNSFTGEPVYLVAGTPNDGTNKGVQEGFAAQAAAEVTGESLLHFDPIKKVYAGTYDVPVWSQQIIKNNNNSDSSTKHDNLLGYDIELKETIAKKKVDVDTVNTTGTYGDVNREEGIVNFYNPSTSDEGLTVPDKDLGLLNNLGQFTDSALIENGTKTDNVGEYNWNKAFEKPVAPATDDPDYATKLIQYEKDLDLYNRFNSYELVARDAGTTITDNSGVVTITGVNKSDVTKARLDVYLNDMTITYGDDYSKWADKYSFKDIIGTDEYLNGDTYDSIITADSLTIRNGGYVDDGHTKTQNAGTLNLFSDAKGSSDLKDTTIDISHEATNHVDNRYLVGESKSGNYDVYVHSGTVEVKKKEITYNPVNAEVTYNDKSSNGNALYEIIGTPPTLDGLVYDDAVILDYDGVTYAKDSEYDTANKNKANSTTAAVKWDNDTTIGTYVGAVLDNASLKDSDPDSNLHSNYVLKVAEPGTIKVNPKAIEATGFESTIVYGDTNQKNFEITKVGSLTAVDGTIAEGDKISLNTNNITKDYITGSTYATSKGDKNTASVIVLDDHSRGSYADSLSVTGLQLDGEDAKNYILKNNATGSITVLPRELTVTANSVSREYGDKTIKSPEFDADAKPHDYYVSVTGWAEGESDLASKIVVKNIQDGAVDKTKFTKGEKQETLNVGEYNWTAEVDMYESLHNYTFGKSTDAKPVEQVNVGNASYVTAVNFDLDINSIKMIYGAIESGDQGILNTHYENGGEEVYQSGVQNAYGFDLNFLRNGDTIADVIGSGPIGYNNTGFIAEEYAGNKKTDNVGSYELKFTDSTESAIEAAVNNNSNYTLNEIHNGTVEVKHALITANGGTIYRNYGDAQKYKLVDGNLETTDTYHYEDVTGWVYDDNKDNVLSDKLTVEDKSSNHDLDTVFADGGLASDTTGGKVTNNVGNWAWENGSISMSEKDAADDLKNYRIWNDSNKEAGLTGDIGGASIVLPKEITINLANQTIVYGTDKTNNLQNYSANLTVLTESAFVNGDSDNIYTYFDSSVQYDYVEGKAYLANGHTNNVNNQTPYQGAITISGDDVFDTATQSNAYVGVNKQYTTFKNNSNYAVTITGGDVTITPKQLTVDALTGTVTYGDKNGNAGINASGGTHLTGDEVHGGIAYNDNVTVQSGAITVVQDSTYVANKTKDGTNTVRTTGDVGTWANALTRDISLVGDDADNYILVNSIDYTSTPTRITNVMGTLTVNPAEITVGLNHFNVTYGMNKDSLIVVNDQVMTVADAEKVLNYKQSDLVNGDNIDDVISINTVDNKAFTSDNRTNHAKDEPYDLFANSTTLTDNSAVQSLVTENDHVIRGTAANGNYIVNVEKGSVVVDPRPVIVIPEGQTIPVENPSNPFRPGIDDPKVVWSPDVVYVQALDVKRTYGDTALTDGYKPGGSGTPVYGIKVQGLAYDPGSYERECDDIVSDNGLKDGNKDHTNNAGSYNWVGDITDQFDSNYVRPENVIGKSSVEKANLEITLNSINGIVYGVTEDMLQYSAAVTGGTYENGLSHQDIVDGKTLFGENGLLQYKDQNTGYVNNNGVSNFAGNTYYHNAIETNLQNPTTTTNEKVEGVSEDGNYNVVINSGEITFQNRHVVIVNPDEPMPNPQKPNLTDPTNPNYDPHYDPTNPNDIRNQVFVQANTVERTYGNPKSDKPYEVTIVGAPEWDKKNGTKDVSDKVSSDNGMKDGDVASNYTNVVGSFDWSTSVGDVFGSSTGYQMPSETNINGISKVDRAPLVVKVQNTTAVQGQHFGKYDYDIDNVVNGDNEEHIKDLVLQAGGYGFNNPYASKDGVAVGNIGYYEGQLGFVHDISGNHNLLGNYTVTYIPGDIEINPAFVPNMPIEEWFPWLHRTNTDHGFSWGKQEHWRERKAEVNFVHGGADFFYDLHERQEIDRQKSIHLASINEEHIEVDAQKHVYIVDELGNHNQSIAEAEAADDEALKN